MFKLIFLLLLSISAAADYLVIDKGVYKAWYSSELEQPTKVSYVVLNRPNIVDREGMNFYKEADIHTSDNKDYYNNEWDKGHMAPAIHFSDSIENLKAISEYLSSRPELIGVGEEPKLLIGGKAVSTGIKPD